MPILCYHLALEGRRAPRPAAGVGPEGEGLLSGSAAGGATLSRRWGAVSLDGRRSRPGPWGERLRGFRQHEAEEERYWGVGGDRNARGGGGRGGPAPLPAAEGSGAGLCRLPRPCVCVRWGVRSNTLPCVWVWRGVCGTGLLLLLPPALCVGELWGGRALPPPLLLFLCVEWENGARPCCPPPCCLGGGWRASPDLAWGLEGLGTPLWATRFPSPLLNWALSLGGRVSAPMWVHRGLPCSWLSGTEWGAGVGQSGCCWAFPSWQREEKKQGKGYGAAKIMQGSTGLAVAWSGPRNYLQRGHMGASLRCFSQGGVNAARFQHSWHEQKLVGAVVQGAMFLLVGFLTSLVLIFYCPNTC